MRTHLTEADTIDLVDWADIGDLYYGPRTEDGERPVLRPDREAVLRLITEAGRRYTLGGFGTDFRAAFVRMNAFVAQGWVDLERGWVEGRPVYGSEAYVADDIEALDVAQEREEARWEEPGSWSFRRAS